MGAWSLQSVSGRHEPLNTTTHFGTNWYVTYRLKYTPQPKADTFVEPPKMAWDETILFIDDARQEWWDFSGNLYTRKPDSPTMEVWAQRYFRAYLHATNQPYAHPNAKGHSRLIDKHGAPVKGKALGPPTRDARAQTTAVKNYLSSHGGTLEIEVHDVPSILKPQNANAKRVERVLVFNCGMTGSTSRATGWQHLKIDSHQPENTWTYNFQQAGDAPRNSGPRLRIFEQGWTKLDGENQVPQSDLLPDHGIW